MFVSLVQDWSPNSCWDVLFFSSTGTKDVIREYKRDSLKEWHIGIDKISPLSQGFFFPPN